jgi:predicted HicB family RNase H-like nuclease
MNEKWKDMKGYEGLYQVSNSGKVKRKKKDQQLQVKMTPEFKDKLRKASEKMGISMTGFVEDAIDEKIANGSK